MIAKLAKLARLARLASLRVFLPDLGNSPTKLNQ
jgi:hypothetical protein